MEKSYVFRTAQFDTLKRLLSEEGEDLAREVREANAARSKYDNLEKRVAIHQRVADLVRAASASLDHEELELLVEAYRHSAPGFVRAELAEAVATLVAAQRG